MFGKGAGGEVRFGVEVEGAVGSAERTTKKSEAVVFWGRFIIGAAYLLLLIKLGFVSSAHWGSPKWQPWTWRPGPIFRNTLTTGGDTGAHVWTPWFLKRYLLPSGRLTGWSKDWYAGFPVLQFYFPVPAWAMVGVGAIVGPNVGFKLVSVAGMVVLPWACMRLARAAGLESVYRYLMGLGAFLFLFTGHFEILGGNIPSTMAGEFSFSISLTLAIISLGLILDVWLRGEHVAWLAACAALGVMSHLLPTIFLGTSAVLILCCYWTGYEAFGRMERLAKLVFAGVTASLLSAVWILPFAATLPYSNDMGWAHTSTFLAGLLPGLSPTKLSDAPRTGVVVTTAAIFLAGIGAAACWCQYLAKGFQKASVPVHARLGLAVAWMMAASGVAFVFTPQYRLWNERALPFYYLSAYLLAPFGVVAVVRVAAVGAAQLGRRIRSRGSSRPQLATANVGRGAFSPPRFVRQDICALSVVSVLALWGVGGPLSLLPSWFPLPKLDKGHLSLQRVADSSESNAANDWPAYNYNGYQAVDDWPEFNTVMRTMKSVSASYGCGRALWDYEDELDRYGTSMGMMLLPYFTNGCVSSMEGLYFESSATTPYHFLNASLLSAKPSNPQSDLPYKPLDVATGVAHLQQFGVRYYMAFSPAAQGQAAGNPALSLVATTPYKRSCSDKETKENTCPTEWQIFLVRDSEVVSPLKYQPVVATGIAQSQTGGWLDLAVSQYNNPDRFEAPIAAAGPSLWQRIVVTAHHVDGQETGSQVVAESPDLKILPRVNISRVVEGEGKMSFDVDRTGIPVLVKESYFPNWKSVGADGPWRIAPNFMVVVPSAKHVELSYGSTPFELLGKLATLAGLLGLAAMTFAARVNQGATNLIAGLLSRDTDSLEAEVESRPPIG